MLFLPMLFDAQAYSLLLSSYIHHWTMLRNHQCVSYIDVVCLSVCMLWISAESVAMGFLSLYLSFSLLFTYFFPRNRSFFCLFCRFHIVFTEAYKAVQVTYISIIYISIKSQPNFYPISKMRDQKFKKLVASLAVFFSSFIFRVCLFIYSFFSCKLI